MNNVELTGALDGLKIADLSDLAQYKDAITAGEQMGFAYYFPSLLSYNRPGRSEILFVQDEDSVCVFRWKNSDSRPKLDVLLAPAPMNISVLRRCLERANDFNGDNSARVLKIDAKDADIVASVPHLRVKERKSQYLFSTGSYADISGREYRSMRRGLSKVRARDGLEVCAYTTTHSKACLELLEKWRKKHRQNHDTLGGVGLSRRIIELAGKLDGPDMLGEVLFIDGRLVGFAFGGEIRPGYAAFLEAKCDYEIQGLSIFQRYSFMSGLEQYELINDGPDVGRAGLAQLKNNLRPVGMHIEYQARQR